MRAERLVVGEVVEGVVDRRRRVGDRQEAGVIEARQAVERSLAVVEEDRAVLADLREDAVIVGVVGLAGERAGGQLAEDVQGVVPKRVAEVSAGVEDQARRAEQTGIGLPPPRSRCSTPGCRTASGVDGQRAERRRRVGDVMRQVPELVVQGARRPVARQVEVVGEAVGREVDDEVGGAGGVVDGDRAQDGGGLHGW